MRARWFFLMLVLMAAIVIALNTWAPEFYRVSTGI
jgi:hypothetical protein